MTTTRDLVEAQSYAVRRVVCAFRTGVVDADPGRRRPVRLLAIGVLLGALTAGAAEAADHLLPGARGAVSPQPSGTPAASGMIRGCGSSSPAAPATSARTRRCS